MEKRIIITKRFRNNTLQVYHYLLKNFSSGVANAFLGKLEQRIEMIASHPAIGKPSEKKYNIRSITLMPHNLIFYRETNDAIEVLCLFDMRRHPAKKPY